MRFRDTRFDIGGKDVTPFAFRGGAKGPILQYIFADGTPGFFFDFSKTDQLFQTVTGGANAAANGNNIALALDNSKLEGRTLAEQIAQASEIVVNGGFDSDTAWVKPTGGTISGGAAVATAVAAFGTFNQSAVFTAGVLYRVEFTCTVTAGGVRVAFSGGTQVNGTTRSASGTYVEYLLAVAGNNLLNIQAGSGGFTGTVGIVSVKAMTGYHGRQPGNALATTPKWRPGGLSDFDGSGYFLPTLLTPNAVMTLMFKGTVPVLASGVGAFIGASGTGSCYIGARYEGGNTVLAAGIGSVGSSVQKGTANIGGTTGVGALKFDGTTVKLYWNSVEVYSGPQSGSVDTTIPFDLGANGIAAGNFNLPIDTSMSHALGIHKALAVDDIAAIATAWGS